MEWFRLQGQLRIAEYSADEDASHRIVAEIQSIGKRRQALRGEIEKHNLTVHTRTNSANGS
jgi:hypothetical protein